jgi:hypothetical protein
MAEKKVTPKKKVRAEKYDEKVHFEGTLEQMIKIAGNTKLWQSNKSKESK